MKEMSQDNLSELMLLLEQKKYDAALSIVTELSEKYPAHQEYFIMRYLVIRILVFQWNLLHPRAPIRSNDVSGLNFKQRLAQMVPSSASFGSFRWARGRRRKLIKAIAGLSCATAMVILAAMAVSGISREFVQPSKRSSADPTNAQPAIAGNVQSRPTTRIASETDPSVQLPREAAEINALRATVEPNLPLLDEHGAIPIPEEHNLQGASREKPRTIRSGAAQAAQNRMSTKQQASGVPQSEQPVRADEPPALPGNTNAAEMLGNAYRSSPIRLRRAPNLAADVIAELETQTSLDVQGFTGPWAKVTVKSSGVSGYVRKEFLKGTELQPATNGH